MYTNTASLKTILRKFLVHVQNAKGLFDEFSSEFSYSKHKSFSTEVSNELKIKPNQKKKGSIKDVAKRNRNLSLEYVNTKKKHIDARSLKPSCSEKKCRLQCTQNISEDTRKSIFDNYWNMGNISRQRDFIVNHTEEIKRISKEKIKS